jgi:hypothetical protein
MIIYSSTRAAADYLNLLMNGGKVEEKEEDKKEIKS